MGNAESAFRVGSRVLAARFITPTELCAVSDRALTIVAQSTSRPPQSLPLQAGAVSACFVVVQDQLVAVVVGRDHVVRTFNVAQSSQVSSFTPENETDVPCLVAAVGPGAVLIGFESGHACIWHPGSLHVDTRYPCLARIALSESGRAAPPVVAAAFEPTRDLLVLGYGNGSLAVVQRESGLVLCHCVGHPSAVLKVVVLPAADMLVSSSTDGSLRAWSLNTGDELCGYQLIAGSMLYSSERDLLFAGASDGRVLAMRFESDTDGRVSATIVKRLEAHKFGVTALAYSADGETLVSCDFDGFVRVLREFAKQPATARSQSTTPLTDAQVRDLFSDLMNNSIRTPSIDELIPDQERLVDLYDELLDRSTQSGRQRHDSLAATLQNVRVGLSRDVGDVTSRFMTSLSRVREKAKDVMEEADDRALSEMRQRHQREMDELRARHAHEEQLFRLRRPAQRREAAARAHRLLSAHARRVMAFTDAASDSLQQLMVSLFESGSIIGERYQVGDPVRPTSSCYRGLDLKTNDLVAIKVFPAAVQLSESLQHALLLRSLDVVRTANNQFVVTPFVPINLAWCMQRNKARLSEREVASVLHPLLVCLAYLHQSLVVHRNVRPSHILVSDEHRVLLTHYGVMRALTGTEPQEFNTVYAAPEMLCRVVVPASDLWSVGCLAVELLGDPERRQALFTGSTNVAVLSSMMIMLGTTEADITGLASETNLADDAVAWLRGLRNKLRKQLQRKSSKVAAPVPSDSAAATTAATTDADASTASDGASSSADVSASSTTASRGPSNEALAGLGAVLPHVSSTALDFVARFLQFDAARRPSAMDALRHPFIESFCDDPHAVRSIDAFQNVLPPPPNATAAAVSSPFPAGVASPGIVSAAVAPRSPSIGASVPSAASAATSTDAAASASDAAAPSSDA